MTDLITEARELCERATPGPWEVNLHNEYYGQGYGETTFFVNIGGTLLKIGIADTAEKYTEYSTLSTFITRSRTLIPELCDALEKAQAQIKRIHQSLDFAETQRQKCKNYPELAINNGLALGQIAVALKHDFKQPLPAPPEGEVNGVD